jgi:hypothetical protein
MMKMIFSGRGLHSENDPDFVVRSVAYVDVVSRETECVVAGEGDTARVRTSQVVGEQPVDTILATAIVDTRNIEPSVI